MRGDPGAHFKTFLEKESDHYALEGTRCRTPVLSLPIGRAKSQSSNLLKLTSYGVIVVRVDCGRRSPAMARARDPILAPRREPQVENRARPAPLHSFHTLLRRSSELCQQRPAARLGRAGRLTPCIFSVIRISCHLVHKMVGAAQAIGNCRLTAFSAKYRPKRTLSRSVRNR
jgi:hypothetical protein